MIRDHDDLQPGGFRSSDEIETDIRRTRSRMDATLDEISERINARYLLNLALDWWEDRNAQEKGRVQTYPAPATHTEHASSGAAASVAKAVGRQLRTHGAPAAKTVATVLGRKIQEKPLPSLLIGAGIAWYLMQDNEEEELYIGETDEVFTSSTEPAVGGYYTSPTGGVGVAGSQHSGPGFTDKVKEKASHAKDAVVGAAGAVADKISSAGSAARDRVSAAGEAARESFSAMGEATRSTAGSLSYSAQERASRARMQARGALARGRYTSQRMGRGIQQGYRTSADQLRTSMDEYPLAAGIGFAAVGALLGLLLPHTRREDELIGERSDELLDTVKERSREVLEKGKAVAERVATTALQEVQNQGLTPEAAGGVLSGLAAKAGEVLHKVKDEAASAVKDEGLTISSLQAKVSPEGEVPSASQASGLEGEFLSGVSPVGESHSQIKSEFQDENTAVSTRPSDSPGISGGGNCGC